VTAAAAPPPAAAPLRRRRFLGITAAACGLPLLPFGARAATPRLRVWTGAALGADAVLQIHHPDPATADRLIAAALAEVRRLEAIMSLYRNDSALVRLNRAGVLDDPPPDLVRVLAESARFHAMMDGMFDVTVQPLWQLYAGHFGRPGADPAGPPAEAVQAAVARVGQDRVEYGPGRIRFRGPGMGITLNSIGQGYITDRVVELLRAGGVAHALVDMGKMRAIGTHPSGTPWRVGLENPDAPGEVAERIALLDEQAVGTAGGYATVFDAAGRFNHIFNPFDGSTSWRFRAVSVIAPTATEANALSTAFTLAPLEQARKVIRARGLAVHFVLPDGSRITERA
jgi:thiamine biosynthesis lipoprotein